jgi:hypothetical protein
LSLLSDCVEQPKTSIDEAVQGYRLMSLSYFRQHSLVEARWAIRRILSIDPLYRPNPVEDPPSYALLVSMVRDLEAERDPTRLTTTVLEAASSTAAVPLAPLDSALTVDWRALADPPAESALSFENDEAVGNEAHVGTNGLRLTHRNHGYEFVNGLNLTLWMPRTTTSDGRVSGLALGIPATGAARLQGLGIGVFGVAGSDALHGIGLGGLGLTAGRLNGLGVGGLGLHVTDALNGLSLTGGVTMGRGSVRGLSLNGMGAWVGGSITGIQVGGLGLRAGGDRIGGLTVGTLGVSSGGDLLGLTASGTLIHAGDLLWGIGAAAGPIVASRVQGLALGSVVVQGSGTGLIVAPLYAHSGPEGHLTGLSLSTFNHVRGTQRGLTIGLFNYASTLQGVQLGLLNYAGNNPRFLRLIPGLNLNF